MSIYKQFLTDTSAETDGAEIVFAANEDGTIPTFRVARMGGANKRYAAELTRQTRPLTAAIRNGMLSDDQAKRISLNVFIETVLLDWYNMQDAAGNIISYSKPAARKLFEDLPDLYEELVRQAMAITTFQIAELDETAKN
jgi:hypothetical protein